MSVHEFRDDEAGYLAWRDENPNGFVINIQRSHNPANARLHEAGCVFLINPIDQGLKLDHDYVKICGSTVKELDEWAIARWGERVRDCAMCRGDGGGGGGGDDASHPDGGLCPKCRSYRRSISGKCPSCDDE